ncbi:MAG: VTT domain-containing protein [Saprospiraceae bacterium]|nr:VTT domain-containing protein [Saprospiraceae bacterium]
MRLFLLFLFLVALVLIPFLVWGESMMQIFSQDGAIAWLRDFDSWAWFAGILLLMSDLVLPIPATLVMASMGYLYGSILGGFLAASGSFISGSVAYWLCRLLGDKAALWLLGSKDFAKGKKLFRTTGGWIVVLSRWLPVFPEVIACMAGLTRMPTAKFHLALACSALPMGFVYAAIGHAGLDQPVMAVVLSAGLPPLIWLMIQIYWKKRSRSLYTKTD